ncbi:MAG: hypothetical protein GOU99_01855 [Candidatus Altiarchaeota archaeon]|nr:hypothetical protein [Candidatus Altiarchaeota archaeon]
MLEWSFAPLIVILTAYFVIKKDHPAIVVIFMSILSNIIFKLLAGIPSSIYSTPNLPVQLAASLGPFIGWPILLYALAMFVDGLAQPFSAFTGLILGYGIGLWMKKRSAEIMIEAEEARRKTFHTITGLLFFIIPTFLGKTAGLLAVVAGMIFLLVLPNFKYPFKTAVSGLHRKDETFGGGAFTFLLGSIVPILIGQYWIILVLAIGDGIATLVGRFLGKTKIYKKKSLEGTLSGFFAAYAISKMFYSPALIPAVIYTLVELFSPIDDNITVPISLCLLYVPWSGILKPLLELYLFSLF